MRVQALAVGAGALLLSFFVLSSLGSIPIVRAQSSTTLDSTQCANLGGTWANYTSTCTLMSRLTITQNSSLIIPSGTTLVASTIENYGGIRVFGNLFNNNATLDNYGSVDNSGTLYNNRTVNNFSGGRIINEGDLTNDKGGRIENSGSIINTDTGTIHNNGTIYDDSGSSLSNYGTFWNGGYIINYGSFFNLGTVNTYNLINNEATIDNGGTIDNTDIINNYGTITNECGAVLSNGSGSNYSGNDVVSNQCTSTTQMTTSTQASTTPPMNSTTEAGGNMTDTGGSSSGGDIPEFPFQALTAAALTLAVAVSYLAIRRREPS